MSDGVYVAVPKFGVWLSSIAGEPLPPWHVDMDGLEDDDE